jgi:hypothetical protein
LPKEILSLVLKGRKAMTDIEKRTGMTDAECEYWDRYIIENPYEPGPNLLKLGLKPGFGNIPLKLSELDKEVISYLYVQAEEFHKSPTQVINDLVREKLAVGTL